MALWRIELAGEQRLAVGDPEEGPEHVLRRGLTLGELLGAHRSSLTDLARLTDYDTDLEDAHVLSPIDEQPVWAAGVTFERSREGRRAEASSPSDVYDRVYDADRPELFFKALPGDSRGPEKAIGIRADSGWDVPEPELGLVADHRGRVVGYVLGNDVSSRSIEGENPLYLPQAKIYEGSCAIGPCVVLIDEAPSLGDIKMVLTIERAGDIVYQDSVRIANMRRKPVELVDWLYRAKTFPAGVVLLTGTSIVPDPSVSLAIGDQVTVAASGFGSLRNVVESVG
jgi:2-dehydro-3-deoxy-D-arabinonate dehydratase